MSNEGLGRSILRKLWRRKCIGGKHISLEDLIKSTPKHLRGALKGVLRGLVKGGLVRRKPTSYGDQFSLDPKRVPEVLDEIDSK